MISNGIDVDTGLSLLGDMDMYNDTIKEFLNGINDRALKLKKFLETNDMPNYAIEAHALKSDSKYLGFTKLIDLAYNHEMKSKENDVSYISEHYKELMIELSRIVAILKKYI